MRTERTRLGWMRTERVKSPPCPPKREENSEPFCPPESAGSVGAGNACPPDGAPVSSGPPHPATPRSRNPAASPNWMTFLNGKTPFSWYDMGLRLHGVRRPVIPRPRRGCGNPLPFAENADCRVGPAALLAMTENATGAAQRPPAVIASLSFYHKRGRRAMAAGGQEEDLSTRIQNICPAMARTIKIQNQSILPRSVSLMSGR